MGAANKGIFFKVAESISKLIRCSKNPSSYFHYIPKHQHDVQHNVNMTNNNMKLLLRRSVNPKPTCGSNDVHYFSMLCSDNNGRHFSLGKNYYLGIHGPADHLFPARICGSCNGILCLEDFRDLGNVVLWNPFTDELKSLPPSSLLSHPEADDTFFLNSGFGFDAGSQDYKVVRQVKNLFTYDDDSYKATTNHYELFSLKTDSWRPIDNPEIHPWYCNPTYLKGFCYWCSLRGDGVLSFDFANEVFSSLPFPLVSDCFSWFLLDFDGSLGSIGYLEIFENRKRFDLFVWNNESWTKVDSFVLEGVQRPLGFWGRDKCFLVGTNNELLLFDLTTRELKPLGIKDCPGAMAMVLFVESTVSINGHSKVGELHTEERKEESVSNEGSSNDIPTDEIRLRTLDSLQSHPN